MKIKLKSICEAPEKISDVLALHKENTKTLGFLPEKVFHESAKDNKNLIATNESATLGYLLFNINKKGNFIYVYQKIIGRKVYQNCYSKN